MRNFAHAVVAVALGVAAAVPPAAAADLDYTGDTMSYRSCGEPWATRATRPPHKGFWYYEDPVPPTVNFLVPCYPVSRAYKPYTPGWYDYCARRWPTFNPATGFVMTPDGPRRCV